MKRVITYLAGVLWLARHLRPLEKIVLVIVGAVAFSIGAWLGTPTVAHVIWTRGAR